jgi:hypothetical protein
MTTAAADMQRVQYMAWECIIRATQSQPPSCLLRHFAHMAALEGYLPHASPMAQQRFAHVAPHMNDTLLYTAWPRLAARVPNVAAHALVALLDAQQPERAHLLARHLLDKGTLLLLAVLERVRGRATLAAIGLAEQQLRALPAHHASITPLGNFIVDSYLLPMPCQ